MRLRLFLLGLCVFLSQQAFAEESDYVLKFSMVDTKPYFYQEDGKHKGETIEYLDRLCEKAKCKYEPRIFPINRLLDNLIKGEVDIAFLPSGTAVEVNTIMLDQHSSKLDVGLYYPADKTEEYISDLNGKSLIVIKDYTYTGALMILKAKYPEMKTVVVNSSEATFKMLEKDRGDIVLAYKEMAEATGVILEDLNYKSVHKDNIYLVISPETKHPNLEQLVNDLNKANDELVAEDKAKKKK